MVDLNATKYFITEQNCDPNSRGQNGWTPLHQASKGGHINIIKYLITELDCDPTILDSDGDHYTLLVEMATSMLPNISSQNKSVIQIVEVLRDGRLYIMLVKVVT